MQLDIVSVLWLGVIRHIGIRVTLPSGVAYVYANSPRQGTVRQSVAQFAGGRKVSAAPIADQSGAPRIIRRAENLLGRPYSLFTWNCEHFVAAALGLQPESKQVALVLWAVAGAVLVSGLVK